MIIYHNLYEKEEYDFDLLKKIKFKLNSNFTASNYDNFNRKVSFKKDTVKCIK